MEDLSLHILDVVGNATRAGASEVTIDLDEDPLAGTLRLRIADNGRGMDEATARRALDPFYTTRSGSRVGLGLPLLCQAAEETGGSLQLTSHPDAGTTVTALFRTHHPDMKPLGDVYGTLATLVAGNPSVRFRYHYGGGGAPVHFDSHAPAAE